MFSDRLLSRSASVNQLLNYMTVNSLLVVALTTPLTVLLSSVFSPNTDKYVPQSSYNTETAD